MVSYPLEAVPRLGQKSSTISGATFPSLDYKISKHEIIGTPRAKCTVPGKIRNKEIKNNTTGRYNSKICTKRGHYHTISWENRGTPVMPTSAMRACAGCIAIFPSVISGLILAALRRFSGFSAIFCYFRVTYYHLRVFKVFRVYEHRYTPWCR